MKKAEIKKILDEAGVEYGEKDTIGQLRKLLSSLKEEKVAKTETEDFQEIQPETNADRLDVSETTPELETADEQDPDAEDKDEDQSSETLDDTDMDKDIDMGRSEQISEDDKEKNETTPGEPEGETQTEGGTPEVNASENEDTKDEVNEVEVIDITPDDPSIPGMGVRGRFITGKLKINFAGNHVNN